jgi:hypothetical protein
MLMSWFINLLSPFFIGWTAQTVGEYYVVIYCHNEFIESPENLLWSSSTSKGTAVASRSISVTTREVRG